MNAIQPQTDISQPHSLAEEMSSPILYERDEYNVAYHLATLFAAKIFLSVKIVQSK